MKILRPSFKMKSLETELSNKINSIELSNEKSNFDLLLELFNYGVESVQPNILEIHELPQLGKPVYLDQNGFSNGCKAPKPLFANGFNPSANKTSPK